MYSGMIEPFVESSSDPNVNTSAMTARASLWFLRYNPSAMFKKIMRQSLRSPSFRLVKMNLSGCVAMLWMSLKMKSTNVEFDTNAWELFSVKVMFLKIIEIVVNCSTNCTFGSSAAEEEEEAVSVTEPLALTDSVDTELIASSLTSSCETTAPLKESTFSSTSSYSSAFFTYLLKMSSIRSLLAPVFKLSKSNSSSLTTAASPSLTSEFKVFNPKEANFSRKSPHSINGICKFESAEVTNAVFRAVVTSEVIPDSKLIVNAWMLMAPNSGAKRKIGFDSSNTWP
ncbi:hypothetical protein WICPIJ_009531 [Wickerhamomyces pijperi]|uniref:Uncharacterized protein n=1 Tax=Wickerhamomyces pijperi TaxID=599730 RepID=A0A9P8PLX5_WICPI|nr:hypothetical protein WICPIJ_009531 [Wickerhamomyces pijperi]